MNKPLEGQVAVVAGATRGAGRGIAVKLGEAGATVYVTGRTTRDSRSDVGRGETIDETAELVTAAGGVGIAVRTDHTVESQVKALFERVDREQEGRLDILVNDVWGCESLIEFGRPFWEQPLSNGLTMQQRAVVSHLITNYYGVPLMVKRRRGLVIEVTDGVDYSYRGMLYYSMAKVANIHLAAALAEELRPYGVAALSLTPGFLRSEQMLDHFGVTKDNWRDAAAKDPHFLASETPAYIGAAVVALASDPGIFAKSGQAYSTWRCADEYGIRDEDGTQPHWGSYYAGIQHS
ncbi:SDR family oxidoreductase [Paenibacillus sp.]|uniref:SDR family oxidoreductase n=1 Tax=Paenibacillus sp. TaxID=58172 RepID=UPI002D447F3D|nr:SDR family oxidoreductase [Paenibacillus sp.]HZG83452.1 SDR family oxidoreductase [Paenibacillus sp.]